MFYQEANRLWFSRYPGSKMSQIRTVCISLVVLWAMVATAQRAAADVFPQSSRQNLLQSELASLTCDSLWLAKGEIYARNGFRFSSKRGLDAFGAGGNTKTPRLSDLEKFNVSRIEEHEYDKGC